MRALLIFCGLAPVMALAAPVSFKTQIAPILRAQCQSCHGAQEAKGDYRVDSFTEVMRALEDEPARVLAAKPNESLFLKLLITADDDERMPQKADKLPAKQIALIRQWIAEGAKFDGNNPKSTLAEIIPARKHVAAPAVYPRALPITALALSPDGKTIAASGLREITLWNLEGKLVRRISNMTQRTFALAWLPDGETLLAGGGIPGELGEVRAFTQDGKLRAVVHQASDVVLDVQLDANATRLAVADAVLSRTCAAHLQRPTNEAIVDFLRTLHVRRIIRVDEQQQVEVAVADMADQVAVMYFGKVVEVAAANSIFARARHPYTNLLARTVPRRGDGIFAETQGELPDPLSPPQGCAFRARCPNSGDICMNLNPSLHKGKAGAHVACHFANED